MARSSRLQLGLRFRTWGGRRAGAGRPPTGERAGVPHLKRPPLASRFPVMATWRVARGLPDLRRARQFRTVVRGIAAAREQLGGRVVHFSVQSNHVHLIVEARDGGALSRALQGLGVRIARGLNGTLGRSGRVFADRYHSRILKTPLEVSRAIRYVLLNARKHAAERGGPFPSGWLDGCSSAAWFDGWKGGNAAERALGLSAVRVLGRSRASPRSDLGSAERPVALPRTWLLRVGWRQHGLIDPEATPGLGGMPRARSRESPSRRLRSALPDP